MTIVEIKRNHPNLEDLSSFSLGTLDDESVAAFIEAHVENCTECWAKLETIEGDALEKLVRSAELTPLASDDEPMPEWLECFRLEKSLGSGGMGTVYLAEDTRLNRKVALKTLKRHMLRKPDAKVRFLREAQAVATLNHDHIVPIYYAGEADGILFLVMPVLKGNSLENHLKRVGGKMELAECLHIVPQIAAGLSAAHAQGLIHRDIKPSNIWIEPEQGGRVRILDFGLAKSAESSESLTQSGKIVGTPAYMAPEQASDSTVDARADLFSLGCVLYQMITGSPPFGGGNVIAILNRLAHETPDEPISRNPDCPPELSRLVMCLLEKEPARRPVSAEAVLASLANLAPVVAASVVLLPDDDATDHSTDSPNLNSTVLLDAETVTRPAPRKPRWPIAAALVFLIGGGVLMQQIIIRLTDKKGNVREISAKPDEKIEIVQEPKPTPSTPASHGGSDLRAADYALSLGGIIRINGQEQEIHTASELPKGPFHLTSVNLHLNQQVTDVGLAHFTGCKNLTGLYLSRTQVTDEGLAHFTGCKNLMFLHLGGTKVTAAGLAHFQDCKNLLELDLSHSRVTDAAVAHFKDCKKLTRLYLNSTRVTDAALVHFEDCKDLEHLHIGATRVTDAGLAHFKDCKSLMGLRLGFTKVTDVGLAYFKGCKNLAELHLNFTRVTDEGLAHFKGCKNLVGLRLNGTRVTDAGLAHFEDCKNLTYLDLQFAQIDDAGLAHLKDCKNLTAVYLSDTQVADAGLAQMGDCKNLAVLHLNATQVTDAGITHLLNCKDLRELSVLNTKVTPKGLEKFHAALPGCRILHDGDAVEPKSS